MTDKKGSIARKFMHGGLKLGSSQAIVQACSFLRNVILARLISTADFGIASIFGMTFYLLEMISNLATETLLVQAEDGDDPPFQATAHLIQAGRGLINATVIFLLAMPISHLFGVPQARWAFACIALVPLTKAFTNLDPSRMQRHMRFEPGILMNLIPSVAVTLLVYPLAVWLRNYTAMLWLLVAQMAITVLVSHLVAERRYSWAWNSHYAKRIFTFGWPLLINGLLMYLIFQGDRFVIGAAHQVFPRSNFTLGDLGVYSVAFTLTMAPSLLVANVTSALFLPVLSRAQGDREQFNRRYLVCAQILVLAAAMISIPFVVAGGPLVVFVFGKKYAAAISVVGWLGAMQFLRTMRVAPTIAAMSLGDTENSMYSNIARTAAFLGILIVVATGRSLSWVAACGFFGEALALTVCLGRLQSKHSVRASVFLKTTAAPGAGLALSALIGYLGVQEMHWPIGVLAATCLMAIVFLAMMGLSPGLRDKFWSIVFRSEPSATT
jgi:O-antigen/teichoic acid export membrane protein